MKPPRKRYQVGLQYHLQSYGYRYRMLREKFEFLDAVSRESTKAGEAKARIDRLREGVRAQMTQLIADFEAELEQELP